ncbi:MAG: CIC family chloride channel protein [Halieaceae bacterium]
MRINLDCYRRSLTQYESALAYALLGIVAGMLAGSAVIAFEYSVDKLAILWGVGDNGEAFETLSALERFLHPIIGALLLGLGFALLRPEDREVGIVHVISRLHSNYGMLPWRNAIVQFVGGAIALASGQSGGREGPGVHLGSSVTSLVGQSLSLPNNSLRVLVACGSAGGIAAAFNTPLAGVIFAMEVIVSEYTVAGFMPVMLAAVAASAVSRQLGGGASVFDMSSVQLGTLWEIPYIIVLGICCGTAVAMFIRISTISAGRTHWPVAVRFAIAGTVTGALGVAVPEVLGIGYDTLGRVLYGDIAVQALLLIAGAKLLATALSVGFGMPVGLIGPNLLIGACIGGFLGIVGNQLFPAIAIDPTLYVTIGMAATMGAVFGAPLAASLAVIELTQSTSVAMPALLAIVAANLTNLTLFRQRSAHRSVLRQLQRQLPDDPLNQLLHRTDVNAVLDGSVVILSDQLGPAVRSTLSLQVPTWCLITREGENLFLVSGSELLQWLENNPPGEAEEARNFDVTESSLRRWSIGVVPEQATLRQTLDILRTRTVEAVCVYSRSGNKQRSLRGVVTRDRIERFTLDHLTH